MNYKDLIEYIVYEDGDVFSKKYKKFIKPRKNRDGYFVIALYLNGKRYDVLHHRLIANCFISNPFDFEQVNHIDGNKSNNNVNNLEWCDNSYNQKHAIKNGLKKYRKIALFRNGKYIKTFDTIAEAQRETGCSRSGIQRVLRKERKTVSGNEWRYV